MYKRTCYKVSNGVLVGFRIEDTIEPFNFLIFPHDNEIIVNSSRKKISKTSILFDLQIISKYIEQDKPYFKELKGIGELLVIELNKQGIEIKEIKEAMQLGKNNSKRQSLYTKLDDGANYLYNHYIVGKKPKIPIGY